MTKDQIEKSFADGPVKRELLRKYDLKANLKCPHCEKDTLNEEFRDECSEREFKITGYCQKCQDIIFGGEE